MVQIEDVKVLAVEGKKPKEETLMNVIEAKREKGLELDSIDTESFYLAQTGMEKHIVTMTFKKDDITKFVDETEGEITEELGEEIEDEFL